MAEQKITLTFQAPFNGAVNASGSLQEIIASAVSGKLKLEDASSTALAAYYRALVGEVMKLWPEASFKSKASSKDDFYIIEFSTDEKNIQMLHDAINEGYNRVPKNLALNPLHGGNMDSPVGGIMLSDGSELKAASPGFSTSEVSSLAQMIEGLPNPFPDRGKRW